MTPRRSRRIKWTDDQDKLLVEKVITNDELGIKREETFKEVAELLNRPINSCKNRYYRDLKSKRDNLEFEIDNDLSDESFGREIIPAEEIDNNDIEIIRQEKDTHLITIVDALEMSHKLAKEIDWLENILDKDTRENKGIYISDPPSEIHKVLEDLFYSKKIKYNDITREIRRVEKLSLINLKNI